MELERRYDIDWLRIAAVLLLIPFHTARVFNWEEDFYVKNDPTSVVAQRFIDFVGPWHMSLLFLLAGMATWLAFRYRSAGQYAGERFKRLLVPFIFGLVVIVPPQTWLAYRWHGKGDPSYWSYYPEVLDDHDGRRADRLPGRLHPWAPLVHPLPLRVRARRPADLRLVEAPRERQGASNAASDASRRCPGCSSSCRRSSSSCPWLAEGRRPERAAGDRLLHHRHPRLHAARRRTHRARDRPRLALAARRRPRRRASSTSGPNPVPEAGATTWATPCTSASSYSTRSACGA